MRTCFELFLFTYVEVLIVEIDAVIIAVYDCFFNEAEPCKMILSECDALGYWGIAGKREWIAAERLK